MIAKIVVTPKPVVNDPQGVTVKRSLLSLGFIEVTDVRVGKYVEVTLDVESQNAGRERVEEMCRKLLANHVIEDFRFEVDDLDSSRPEPAPPSTPDEEPETSG